MSTLLGDLRLDTPACMSAGATLGAPAHLPTLNGWRGIAILWVMLFHDHQGLFGPGGVLPCEPLFGFAKRGGVGVDIFFGISGFLIASRLLAERRRSGRIDLRGFYIRRAW